MFTKICLANIWFKIYYTLFLKHVHCTEFPNILKQLFILNVLQLVSITHKYAVIIKVHKRFIFYFFSSFKIYSFDLKSFKGYFIHYNYLKY